MMAAKKDVSESAATVLDLYYPLSEGRAAVFYTTPGLNRRRSCDGYAENVVRRIQETVMEDLVDDIDVHLIIDAG